VKIEYVRSIPLHGQSLLRLPVRPYVDRVYCGHSDLGWIRGV